MVVVLRTVWSSISCGGVGQSYIQGQSTITSYANGDSTRSWPIDGMTRDYRQAGISGSAVEIDVWGVVRVASGHYDS